MYKMKTIHILLFLFCFVSFSASAQTVYSLADTVVAQRLLKEADIAAFRDQKLDIAYAKADSVRLIFEQIFGKESNQFADALQAKGKFAMMQGHFDEALAIGENILALRKKLNGEIHPSVARAYRNFGEVYAAQSTSPKAISAFQKAIEINEKDRKSVV